VNATKYIREWASATKEKKVDKGKDILGHPWGVLHFVEYSSIGQGPKGD
jgi:hypothetical protein